MVYVILCAEALSFGSFCGEVESSHRCESSQLMVLYQPTAYMYCMQLYDIRVHAYHTYQVLRHAYHTYQVRYQP